MNFNKIKFVKDENGNGLLLFGLLLAIFIGFTGFVIDMGILYKTKSELRKVANAAVFSGAQELTNSDADITQVVQDILNAHNAAGTLKSLQIKPGGEKKVKVALEKTVPLCFMKFFGMSSAVIDADATAGISPMSAGIKAVPLGIDKNTQLIKGQDYTLKVGAGDSVYGNFGILALSGVGSNLYEQDLMYGYNDKLKVGQELLTQTGNVAGKTKNAVDYRIASSPYLEGGTYHSDDPRRVLILVYEPIQVQGNQVFSVRICGFAFFYITKIEGTNNNDTTITGKFIDGVGSGIADPTQQDTGAYAVKLMN